MGHWAWTEPLLGFKAWQKLRRLPPSPGVGIPVVVLVPPRPGRCYYSAVVQLSGRIGWLVILERPFAGLYRSAGLVYLPPCLNAGGKKWEKTGGEGGLLCQNMGGRWLDKEEKNDVKKSGASRRWYTRNRETKTTHVGCRILLRKFSISITIISRVFKVTKKGSSLKDDDG